MYKMGKSYSREIDFKTVYDDEDSRDIFVETYFNQDEDQHILDLIVDIRKKMPSPLSVQNKLGYSSIYALCFVLQYEYRKINISFIPSAYFMINNVPKNSEGKCTLRDTLKSLSKNGVCKESSCPSFSTVPSKECFDEAEKAKNIVYERLNKDERTIVNVLDSGSPVIFNYTFYRSFLNCTNNIIKMPIEDDINMGVQTAVICGYEKEYFIVNNNWGTDWGESGYVWIHKKIVMSGSDFWIVNKITKDHVNDYIKIKSKNENIISDEPYFSEEDT